MALTKITKTGIGSGAVDGPKLEADSITQAKIADGAIENEHLNTLAITGQTELAEGAASTDVVLVYDASTGTLKKITQTNLLNFPTISSVSPTNVLTGDGTGNHTFIITGTGFTGATPTLLTNGGSSVSFDSFVVDSATQITGIIAKSSMSDANEPYDVKVTAASGLASTLENQISVDASPIFATASGSLASIFDGSRTGVSITVEATDPESAGAVGYEIIGSLPAGLTSSVASGILTISGTADAVGSNTTTNFSVKANDVASNVSTRAFSITVNAPISTSFTSSGTFSVPSGLTSINVLVVAGGGAGGSDNGGGAGAGGLIFVPGFPVTPGGTVSVTVGDGGPAPGANDYPVGPSGQDSVFGTLTVKGGGGGSGSAGTVGAGGGSGGGGNGHNVTGPDSGGTATQPTQPGQSGAYGFGFTGGTGGPLPGVSPAAPRMGGGGGGAGGHGGPHPTNPVAGDGGIGKAYTIADGTTPVYYAGGGGGGTNQCLPFISRNNGGQGGGGAGSNQLGGNAQANKGGGGGGGGNNNPRPGGSGGKGIVIVQY